ncbi:MAG: nucleotidyltransferase family protein [Chloroflexi bacterium]|nr:nucleotidyltransferase family protein [Chloroflexota bacterium]
MSAFSHVSTQQSLTGPWPDVATARSFLKVLAAYPAGSVLPEAVRSVDVQTLAAWLKRADLGPLAYAASGLGWPELTRLLQPDVYSAMAEMSLRLNNVREISGVLSEAGIPALWLKGVALGQTIYPEAWLRTMSDVDVWLPEEWMAAALTALQRRGYQMHAGREERPLALQQLSQGEIKLTRSGEYPQLVELHWGPLAGWWMARTTAVDSLAMWARRESLPGVPGGYQLEAVDMTLQVAVHLAINHGFQAGAVRGLIDLARLAQQRGVDWGEVAERAAAWRVGTAVSTVLELLDQLIGVAGMEEKLGGIRPSAVRRYLLRRLVTPESVLAGRDVRQGWQRYALLLLLVDRPRDAARLLWRTVWPEAAWLAARYGEPTGHGRHLWRLVRRRAV